MAPTADGDRRWCLEEHDGYSKTTVTVSVTRRRFASGDPRVVSADPSPPGPPTHVHAESNCLSVIGDVQVCMNNGKREQCGFTLIEILVVVLILGVLAAIVIPAFSHSSSDAHLSVCLENLRLIQQALSVYKMNVGTYPSSADGLVGYWGTLPVCPLGGPYDWSLTDDKYHIRCSAQHTLGSNHVCIHEDQRPTVK